MKKLFVTIAILTSTNCWANTTPIEPVLIPIADKSQGINIQMGKYEVTVEEFTRFANATGHKVKEECHLYNEKHTPAKKHGTWSNPDLTKEPYRPVVCIGSEDAIAYANWVADSTGKPYRLPEFDEWQFAASSGKSSRFAFGDDLDHSDVCYYENVDDFAHNAGLKQHHGYRHKYGANCNDGSTYHSVVGMYRPNGFGLHDMMGNVREITKTCGVINKEQPTQCQNYIIAGGAWHWIPHPNHLKNNMIFVGSIEGFRLVLDSSQANPISKQTKNFAKGLNQAQLRANVEHQRLKSMPKRPEGVRADLLNDKQVKLSWSPSTSDDVSYAIYRSYLDSNGALTRKMKKVAEGIKANNYLDQLPGEGAASYQVFANNPIGESQASKEVYAGEHQVFKVADRIQAEFYHHYQKAEVLDNDEHQSVLFSSNDGYYPPGMVPYSPAWSSYEFDSARSGPATLTMNVRGIKGAVIEFWQGNNLVAKVKLEGSREFEKKSVIAELKAGNEPIQIRAADNNYFVLDWFELHYQ